MKRTIATSFCNFQRNITKARAAFSHNFCIFPRTRTSSLRCLNLALKYAVTSITQSHKWHKTIWGVFQMLHIPTSLIYWGKLQKGKQMHLWSFRVIFVDTYTVRGRSLTTLSSFCLFLTTYPPTLTFSTLWMLTKIWYFWTIFST